MIVAGLGFSSAADAAEIAGLVAEAGARAGVAADLVATVDDRAGLPAFAAAAGALGLPTRIVAPEALRAAGAGVVTCSARARGTHDVGSVAEAAALAAAGAGAVLVLPRIASARVTCALARSAEGTP